MADTTVGLHLENCSEPYEVRLSSAGHEEARLVAGLREGAEDAYEQLILLYQQPVYNLICRLMGDSIDAGDVVQEVFLKIFRNIGSFREQSSLKTWIYRIAVNEAYNHRRWFSRHRKQEVGLEKEEEDSRSYQETLADPGQSPFEVAAGHEAHALIEEVLAELSPGFRSVVVLRDIEDMSYEEIGEVLKISLGTVKSRILRGREALRKRLAERLEAGPALGWTPQPAD